MLDVKITESTIKQWPKALNDIFKWNSNKDLILYAHYGNLYLYHAGLFSKFNQYTNNNSVNFNIQLPYYGFGESGIRYMSPLKFKNILVEQPNDNVIMVVQYIESIPEDYIHVKLDNLRNYQFNVDKQIVLLELHSSIMSTNTILDKVEIYNEDFILDTDFIKFDRSFKKINSKVIKLR